MRLPVRCLEITSIESSHSEMERIGVDPAGIQIMALKQFHYNLKVEGLTPAQANIIKQEMLSLGGEAAVARGVASCSVQSTGAVLSGTLKQLKILIEKLRLQHFGLPDLAEDIGEAIENSGRKSFVIKGMKKDWRFGPRTLLMGILNVTPDSFSDGGLYFDKVKAIDRASAMSEEGADIIDIGGESTRPGAVPVTVEEELRRVIPVIETLAGVGVPVSIDTSKAEVARRALQAGAEMVNDVSALSDPQMAEVCAGYQAPLIIMHMRGTSSTMQLDVEYGDLLSEVFGYLLSRMEYAISRGIEKDRIIVDPGIGFGKSREGSLELIRRLSELKAIGRPILVGPSRKSFIGKTLGGGAEERLAGTLAVSTASILNGAMMLRVHDVKEARRVSDMADAIRGWQ